jgi:hypothetical protein
MFNQSGLFSPGSYGDGSITYITVSSGNNWDVISTNWDVLSTNWEALT